MKKFLSILCATLLIPTAVWAVEAPIKFVQELTDKVITDVLSTNDTREKKLEIFRTEFDDSVDLKSIGQFVLGRYWKTATEEQRDAFLKTFINFTTLTWSDRFELYTGQKIIFSGTRNAENNQLYVDSRIDSKSQTEVIWRLRQKGNEYRIIDIIIEGVSMAMSYRNEYTAFLQKNDGDVSKLTAELDEKAKNFKFTSDTEKVAK